MSSPSEQDPNAASGPFPARYFDGQTAVAHEVHLLFCNNGLRIIPFHAQERQGDSAPLAVWPYTGLEIAAGGKGDPQILLKCDGKSGRIRLQSLKAATALYRHAPHLQNRSFPRPHQWLRHAALIALPVATAGLLYMAVPAITRMAASMLPAAVRDALGRQAWDAVTMDGTRLCGNTGILRPLIARLTEGDEERPKITIAIVDAPIINALALPGGRIVLYRGLIEEAGALGRNDGAAALAGVIAHEIGHIRALHPTAGLIRQLGLANMFGLLFGSGTLANIAGMAANLSYSRDMEREADRTAIALLQQAGIATRPLARLLRAMAKREKNREGIVLPEFFSTHPGTDERTAALSAATDTGNAGPPLGFDWTAMKAGCSE